ncbi:hypothetical protein AB7W70_21975, partial [Providencia rettgeri]
MYRSLLDSCFSSEKTLGTVRNNSSMVNGRSRRMLFAAPKREAKCSGQLKLATVLEFFRYWFSDSFGGNP